MNNKILDGFPALGTKWWVEIFQDIKNFEEVKIRIEEEVKNFENKYTRFKETSLLSKLNREREIDFDEEFFELLSLSNIFNKNSKEVFDIFIKEKLEEKGYGQIIGNPLKISGEKSEVKVENNKIILEGNKGIDLGGIGKGYLIDKIANLLQKEFNIKYFLINGGGDIYVTSDKEKEIELLLEHPTNNNEYIYKIKIKNKSLCVSSSFKRSWNKEGKEVNHFITDKEDVWAVTYIVSEKTINADVFGTISCILSDSEKEIKNIYKNFNVEYFVINQKGDTFKSEGFPELI